jgi:hypothetical protein
MTHTHSYGYTSDLLPFPPPSTPAPPYQPAWYFDLRDMRYIWYWDGRWWVPGTCRLLFL